MGREVEWWLGQLILYFACCAANVSELGMLLRKARKEWLGVRNQ
jgi:hypothetical protein